MISAPTAAARGEDRLPCLYKLGARTAAAARRAGWSVRPIAEELLLAPAGFGTTGAARAGLRRKLRHANRAGVEVTCWCPRDPPSAQPLVRRAWIADDWARRRQGERGFSMGRFDADYAGRPRVYLAWVGGVRQGFATFHQGAREWTLDMMRQRERGPDGLRRR